jgi:hypothetical protein
MAEVVLGSEMVKQGLIWGWEVGQRESPHQLPTLVILNSHKRLYNLASTHFKEKPCLNTPKHPQNFLCTSAPQNIFNLPALGVPALRPLSPLLPSPLPLGAPA